MGRSRRKIDSADPVERKIRRIQRTARGWSFVKWYMAAAICGVVLLIAGVLFDHLFILQKPGRVIFFAIFLIVCTLGVLAATLFPLMGRLSQLYVAREIERSNPALRNSLISYLQCKEDMRVPRDVRRLLLDRTYGQVRSVDPKLLAETHLVARIGWALLGLLFIFVVYAFFSPKSVPVSIRRLLAPGKAILPPTRTRIVEVEPGTVYLLRGQNLSVHARIKGREIEHASVVWSGQSFLDKRILLSHRENDLWEGELASVLEDGIYYIAAGDTRSEQYSITTLPQPAVTRIVSTLVPPAYTGEDAETIDDGNLDVLTGTNVVLMVHTNLPPDSGHLQLASGGRVWLDRDEEKADVLTGRLTINRSDSYQVVFETMPYPDGSKFRNTSPVTYQIACRGDQAPRVTISNPPNRIRVAPDARVSVQYGAEDDFGLVKLTLKYSINGAHSGSVELPVEEVCLLVEDSHDWDLSGLSLRPGDEVEYLIEATDNWPRGPNVAPSEARKIFVEQEEQQLAEADPQASEGREEKEDEQPQEEPGEKEDGEAAEQEQPGQTESEEGKDGADGEGEGGEKEGEEPAAEAQRDLAQRVAEAYERAQEQGGEAAEEGDGGPKEGAEAPEEAGEGPKEGAEAGEQGAEEGKTAQGEPSGEPKEGGEPQTCPKCGSPMEDGVCKKCSGGASGEAGETQSAQGEGGAKAGEGAGSGEKQSSEAGQGGAKPSGSGQGGEKAVAQGGQGGKTQGGGGEPCPNCGKPMQGGKCAGCSGGSAGGSGAGGKGSGGAQQGGKQGQSGSKTGGKAGQSGASGGQSTAEGSPEGPKGAPGGAGAVGQGADWQAVAGGERRDGPIPDRELGDMLETVRRQLEEGELPEEMLRDLGMNREQLDKFLKDYLEKQRDREKIDEQAKPEDEESELAGRVLGAGERASDVEILDTAPEVERDEMRSRFEDASNRISPRYRDAVNAYYRKLAGEE